MKTQTELSAQTLKAALKADTNIPDALVNFDRLPNSAFVRLPTVAAWKDISPATVWRWVKLGLLPKPVKIGPNTTAWRVGDLRDATNVGVAA